MKKKEYSQEYIEKLRNAYVIEKRSTTDMSKNSIDIFGFSISPATIYTDMVKNNIPLRSKSESISMATGELDKTKCFLTEDTIEWVDGLMLGDGYINFKKPTFASSRFRLDSSQKEWTTYGMSLLKDYSPKSPETYNKIDEKRPNTIWMSQTLMHPDIIMQARRWYSGPNQTKKIPSDVRITPVSTMLWYLGDGSFHYEPNGNMSLLRLASCAFDKKDLNEIIIPKLKIYNINCDADNSKNDIYIHAESIKDFFNFIGWKSPISCYDYKFNVPEWLKLIRLSEIVKNDKEKWRAQYYYKQGKLDCSKSPGGKMLLFTREQADKLRTILA
jgi:hypothetical protein